MSKTLYVVFKRFQKDTRESAKVMAVCTSREIAWKAKLALHHEKLGSNRDFRIKQVLPDTLYPKSVTNNREILIIDLKGELK